MAKRHVLDPTSLPSVFRRLEELTVAGSGEDAFTEIFKLLVAKLWDERTNGGAFGVAAPARASAIAATLARATDAWPDLVDGRFAFAPAALERAAQVLAPVHLTSSADALDAAFEFLVARDAKGEKGQFFTPRHVVALCLRLARPRAGERVLDPACGSGAFLRGALASARVDAFGWDWDPRAVRVARAMAFALGASAGGISRRDSLVRPSGDEGRFDLIVTNPPFAGELRERALLDSYRFGQDRERVERDVLFVERCVELLAPAGRLVMVLPHGLLARSAHAPLRRWFTEVMRPLAAIGLGRNTFQPHTGQKASVLVAEKRTVPRAADEPIFFAVSERDGKTSAGELLWRAGRFDHDLDDIASAWEEHIHGRLSRRHAG